MLFQRQDTSMYFQLHLLQENLKLGQNEYLGSKERMQTRFLSNIEILNVLV